jgi:hypothetical protein
MARATMADIVAERDAARAEVAILRAQVTVLEVNMRMVRQIAVTALEPTTPGTPLDGPVRLHASVEEEPEAS